MAVILLPLSVGWAPLVQADFQPVVMEFLADNENSIRDEDGDRPDWIEIYNAGDTAGNLGGWCLTDSDKDLAQWVFPNTPLDPDAYLVIFASGKDRAVSGRELHTNFKLGRGGEYLALIRPDRITVASEYSPEYPEQLADISYGLARTVSTTVLMVTNVAADIHIPVDDTLGTTWTQPGFDATHWLHGQSGLGFDRGPPPNPDLVAHWTLDDPLGNAVIGDASGNFHEGVAGSGVTLDVPGAIPATLTAATFNNSSVEVPYHADLNPSSFTVVAWARPVTGGSGYRSVITSRRDSSQNEGYIIYLDPAGQWQFWTGNGSGAWPIVQGPAATLDAWTHLAISFDATTGTKSFTVNGSLYASVADQGYSPNPGTGLHIGGGGDGGDQYRFLGDIDDVAVFNTALDTTAIQSLMQTSIPEAGAVDFAPLITTDIETIMHEVNSSAYIRFPFTVSTTNGMTGLLLNMRFDDGFVAYLNGQLVATRNAPTTLLHNAQATTANPNTGAVYAEEFNISPYLGLLQPGDNLLAIHGLNVSTDNDDFLVVPELVGITAELVQAGYIVSPSPGDENDTALPTLGPMISDVLHQPVEPTSVQDLVVTARITPTLHPVDDGRVMLHHRAMYRAEATVSMADDGNGHDAVAGDGLYTAAIPAGTAAPGEMLRYYITADDTAISTMRMPMFSDREGTKQSPEYFGTRVQDPSVTSGLPIFYWWTSNYAASHSRIGVRASVFYHGEFYDNVFVRARGQATNGYSQKFVFGKSHRFYVNDTLGRVREVNLNAQGADASFIRQTLAFQLFSATGMPACESYLVLMRVNGGSDRVGVLIEQVDEDFLQRYDLDEFGGLYKFVQKQNLNPCLSEQPDGIERKIPELETGFDDVQDLIDGLALTGEAERRLYVFDHFNLPEVISYLTARAITQDCDDVRKNFYMHHDKNDSGEWRMFPWDKDFTYGILGDGGTYATHPFLGDYVHRKQNANQWSRLLEVFFNLPDTRDMFRRRMRTVMDTYLGPPGTPSGQSWVEQRATALFTPADPHLGSGATSAYNGVLNYAATKRTNLYVTHHENNLPGDVAGIPDQQEPQIALQFGAHEASPPSGNQDEEYIQLLNPNAVAVDVSGWTLSGGVDMTFAPGTVILAGNALYVSPHVRAFRDRGTTPRGGEGLFVVGDYRGHLSTLGETVILSDTSGRVVDVLSYTGAASPVQEYLRITEVMYHPRQPDAEPIHPERDYEYIELQNTGSSVLDLTGVYFSDGIEFTFGATSLAPGAFVVVARTPTVFETRYHTGGLQVAGPYNGFLDNGGERIVLKDRFSQTVAAVSYGDGRGWPPAADGAGHALVPRVNGGLQGDALAYSSNWRAGTYRDGSPGFADPERFQTLRLNEVAAHTDYAHPARPEYDSNDWIELFNTTDAAVALADWYLSDEAGDLKKWAIPPAHVVPERGWIVFDEISGFHSPTNTGFGLNKAGEQVFLSYLPGTAADRVADAVRFKGQENGVTLGRYPDGDTYWYATEPTRGGANTRADSDVVIHEIMYHPAPTAVNPENNTNDEYVEIYNPRSSPTPLWTGTGPWRFNGEIAYTFPSNTLLAAGSRLRVVSFDPQTNVVARDRFLAAHGLTLGEVNLLGPCDGYLDNQGGRLALERPQAPDLPGDEISWVIVDEVIYANTAPWPGFTDATGYPLWRVDPEGAGNDPVNWGAPLTDRDGDGMPDAWEELHLGSHLVDPGAHGDGDSMTNRDEYRAGTDPTDPDSLFRVKVSSSNGVPTVWFTARKASGTGYAGLERLFDLERSTNLQEAAWMSVSGYVNIPGTNQVVEYDHTTNTTTYFRVRARLETN